MQRFEQAPAKYEGQRVNGCGTGLANKVPHARVGGVTSKMDALPHYICDDFLSAIAFMYVYE